MTTNKKEGKPNVALVLSSGGARGYAHIGAIEALEERGYHITAVAGASMGSLIGGMYCLGQLAEVKEWLFSLTRRDKVIRTLKEMVPDTPIESLPIPFRAIAADLVTQREVVFSKGSIYRAIRSSISMPSILKPIKVAHHILIDGGIVNPLPLNRVVRAEGDILVSVNVSAPASEEIEERREAARLRQKGESRWLSLHRLMDTFTPDSVASNYMTLITSAIDLQIQRNTVLTQKITPPDVAVNIPMNRFGVFDFNHAEQITQVGYDEMNKALDAFESNQ